MRVSPLRQFVLAAALWLPMAFFLWAVLSSAVVWPVARVADLVLPAWLPHVVSGIEQSGAQLEVVTRLQTATDPQGRVGLLVLNMNPLIYAWCIALFTGLVMATPLAARQRALQLAVGFFVLWLTTSWGAVFDALKLLAFDAGPLGAAAVSRAGLSVDAIALGYQFGYLILPAVTPIALWVVLNRRFLEQLVGWAGEPAGADGGPPPAMDTDATKDKP
ncbi:exosortase H-associated membrane protein [Pseudomarimonas salicorniae]|uniref:Uncharacterized protein n=1 Tax=Pseudomarimonas salicorniae TaxID=2933270 RepID=A0ABT0GJ52_9GAMM|nr:exosortase H-associated membrane protein [Lysobacter sp. CAU 1642]MCK7594571.1 hypothetical protein [Lysobacter sp. CAU 1642]